ncbi:MAG: hypothetical protein JSU70_19525 [Phycisphaerales bacterium]|nr:MAG: hypothetical protein JSU70_19525 [Phycisphaerales bacterium]
MKYRITYIALAVLLVGLLSGLSGCRKKDQPQETQRPSPVESKESIPDQVDSRRLVPAPERSYEPNASGKIDLRILYAGHPDSEREKDFVEFLTKNFKAVEMADLSDFDESFTKDFDVTILDYDGDGFKAPRCRDLSGLSRPVVTVGVPGALMCSGWQLKTGYL